LSKQTLERLIRDWSIEKAMNHDLRKKAFGSGNQALTIEHSDSESGTKASFLRPKTSNDIRIHAGFPTCALQWRSCMEKQNRLIYIDYFSEVRKTVRVALEDIFLDPNEIEDSEYEMFKTLYPEICEHIDRMAYFLDEAEHKLLEMYGK
jgi:hypothetical protein